MRNVYFSCCSFQPRLEIKESGRKLGESVARFAYLFFQNLFRLFQGNVKAIYWNCKNRKQFKTPPPLLFNILPRFSLKNQFPDPFPELLQAYKKINKLEDQALENQINRELKKGTCHAQCQLLLTSKLSELKNSMQVLIFLEVLEIFRASFQKEKQDDLLEKLKCFDPKGFSHEIHCEGLQRKNLHDQNALIITRIYNQTTAHTILLDIDSQQDRFRFYNCDMSGLYEYETLDDFVKALREHVDSHLSFTPLYWDLNFYPRQNGSATSVL